MTVLEQIKKNLRSIDLDAIIRGLLLNKEVQDFIIELNTRDQLFDRGENSLGISLESIGGEYSPFTIEDKKSKGLPFDRITLFDTGDYYDSYSITVNTSDLVINTDPIKDNTNLEKEWGEEIVGLQDVNIQKLINVLLSAFSEAFLFELSRGLLQRRQPATVELGKNT